MGLYYLDPGVDRVINRRGYVRVVPRCVRISQRVLENEIVVEADKSGCAV